MANPTTNYGFVLPTSSDLVTDLPADFEVALQGVDTRMKALEPATTLGDLQYRSATANTNTRLGIGSTGQVLTVSGGVPAWVAPAAGGKVLQVVQGTTTTQTATNSSTYSDSTLTATITPSASTSKILVLVNQPVAVSRSVSSDLGGFVNLLRGSTALMNQTTDTIYGANWLYSQLPVNFNYLDSPATTSATTYKTQLKTSNTAHTITAQVSGLPATIILLEIGA